MFESASYRDELIVAVSVSILQKRGGVEFCTRAAARSFSRPDKYLTTSALSTSTLQDITLRGSEHLMARQPYCALIFGVKAQDKGLSVVSDRARRSRTGGEVFDVPFHCWPTYMSIVAH